MLRFLISTMPVPGHVHPAIPVATSLVAHGHEVLWHTGTEFAATVERTGARLVPRRYAPSFAELPVEPDPGARGPAAASSVIRRLFVDRMAGQLRDYEEILHAFPFDAALVDLCSLGGRALFERHGIPYATLGISPFTAASPDVPPFGTGRRPPQGPAGRLVNRLSMSLGMFFLHGVATAYEAERAKLALPPLPRGVTVFDHILSPMLHLQSSTPSIEFPRRHWPSNVHLVGPLLPDLPQDVELPPWWDELDDAGTVVHITQGTYATDPHTLTQSAVEALADLDGLVVVTTPNPAALGPLPANTRVAGFIPHTLLLPKVDAMVTNAGFNGVKMALANAVPLIMVPWGNDQHDVASRVAWAGAGIYLRTKTPAPKTIATAVHTVLADPSYRQAATRIQTEFAQYPDGNSAATLLEGLVTTKQPIAR